VICILLTKHQEHWLSKIMNEALIALSDWCNVNAMTVNKEKIFYNLEPQTTQNQFKNRQQTCCTNTRCRMFRNIVRWKIDMGKPCTENC
jgi:hypothetical protein